MEDSCWDQNKIKKNKNQRSKKINQNENVEGSSLFLMVLFFCASMQELLCSDWCEKFSDS